HVDQNQAGHLVGTGAVRDQDAGQSAHAGPDQHHGSVDRIQDVHYVRDQGFDGVIGVRSAVTVAVSAGVHRNHVVALVGQDLAGVLPGEPVLAAPVQHE